MSKNKHGDLFNISLTEIIIILFFVLLLFALSSIDKVNKEREALGKEVEILNNEKAELEQEKVEIEAEKDTAIRIIEESDIPISQGKFKIELTRENNELKRVIRKLEEENDSLRQEVEPIEEIPLIAEVEKDLDENGTGNCRDGGNWIQPKCNDYCWQIDEDLNKRNFDYLIDIGVCNSSIVVQRSEWLEKRESDFLVVDGALELVNSNFVSRDKLYEYLDMIKEPGFIKEPKQCFHMARLIDLENVSGDLWNKNGREIRERLGTTDYTSSIQGHTRLKERFQSNVCDLNETSITSKKQVISDQDIKPNNTVSSKASFLWDNNIACNRADGKRTSEFNAVFNILVTDRSRVIVQDFSLDKVSNNNRLLVMDAKASMEKQRKNIKPALNSKNPEDSKIILPVKFPKDVCR